MLTLTEVQTMTAPELKIHENRIRAAAKRQGLILTKSRSRDPRALDYGRYFLSNQRNQVIIAGRGEDRNGVTLDYIDWYLHGAEGSVYEDTAFEAAVDNVLTLATDATFNYFTDEVAPRMGRMAEALAQQTGRDEVNQTMVTFSLWTHLTHFLAMMGVPPDELSEAARNHAEAEVQKGDK